MSKHNEQLGKIIENDYALKDAIHIAIAPVVAAEDLRAGNHIGWTDRKKNEVGLCQNTIGVVDPFITTPIKKGDKFYMCLYPNTITSLRHDWVHQDFLEEDNSAVSHKEIAYKWISHWAMQNDIDFEDLMAAANRYIDYGDYWVEGGRFDGIYLPDEFWDHYEKCTGKVVDEDDKNSFFSCSC
mgnify:CR=1 FL=1